MKRIDRIASLALALLLAAGTAAAGTTNAVLAVDILLQPDETFVRHAQQANKILRSEYPAGFKLDAKHAPQITLVQGYMHAKDLGALTDALARLAAAEDVKDMRLEANGYDYVKSGDLAFAGLGVAHAPELLALQQRVVDVFSPFAVSSGTAAAFTGAPISAQTIAYVDSFETKSSGYRYWPHATIGVAPEEFVVRARARPINAFQFRVKGIAVHQVGNFGTAGKKLWQSK